MPLPDVLMIVAFMLALLFAFSQMRGLQRRLRQEQTNLAKAARDGEKQRAILNAVLRQAPVGVIVARAPTFDLVSVNQQATRILGRAISTRVEGEPLWLPNAVADREHFPLVRSIEHGETVIAEQIHYRGPARKETTLEVSSCPVVDDSGQIIGGVLMFQELTLGRLEQRAHLDMASIVDASDEAIYMLDLKGTVLTWNHGAERIYGYECEEIVGKSVSALLPSGHENEIEVLLERVERGEHLDPMESAGLRRDGSVVPVSVRFSPIALHGKARAVSVVARDLTAQSQAAQALKESEQRYHELADAVPVMIFAVDPSGGCVYCNRRWREYTGQDAEESSGYGWITAFDPSNREIIETGWQARQQNDRGFEFEHRIRNAHGGYGRFLVRCEPVRDERRAIRRWYGTCTALGSHGA